ncbi:MAG: DUF3575 domain-containing protein [Bacteroidales bacterium]|nr:DUF3575 domain-containing protein [Bacteroidales bacterium]
MKVTRNIYRLAIALLLSVLVHQTADAQKWAISTNALTWANLGTINFEGSMAVGQHFTFNGGFTANPWEIKSPTEVEIMNKQYGGYIGARYWPWQTYSEWWIGTKLQYKNFEQKGLLTSDLKAGNALGAGLAAGYSLMISNNFNLDFGLGFWGGRILKQRNFLFLDNVIVSIVYIF